ncbi:unnamed protein product [Linum tenue]|uniref:Uncharacterized protein n=1 Tax=Linum tenue TaxID=586396 RepID=A0AAV0I323_9ROSI|nr:unnamed protein product [Linum tenue]
MGERSATRIRSSSRMTPSSSIWRAARLWISSNSMLATSSWSPEEGTEGVWASSRTVRNIRVASKPCISRTRWDMSLLLAWGMCLPSVREPSLWCPFPRARESS